MPVLAPLSAWMSIRADAAPSECWVRSSLTVPAAGAVVRMTQPVSPFSKPPLTTSPPGARDGTAPLAGGSVDGASDGSGVGDGDGVGEGEGGADGTGRPDGAVPTD